MEPPRTERQTYLVVAGTLWAIVLGVIVIAMLIPGGLFGDDSRDCESYEFDRGAWFRDVKRDEAAATLVRCRVLIGKSRAAVLRMLGPNFDRRDPERVSFAAGWVNDALGPGDGQVLQVHFGANDRVTGAHLLYRPD